jgi:hypothetical protein
MVREVPLNTKKLCMGGYAPRDFRSAGLEKVTAFSLVSLGDRCRLTPEQGT